jgi:hypothetical protein
MELTVRLRGEQSLRVAVLGQRPAAGGRCSRTQVKAVM